MADFSLSLFVAINLLFLDIVRPMLFPASILNHLLINLIRWSPFIRDAHKNQQQWDRKLAEVFERSPSLS